MDSEELGASLRNYEIQLQQVVAALAENDQGGSDRDELLKLKTDLEEVIKLTKDLMSGGPGVSGCAGAGASGAAKEHSYRAGQKVLAPWSEDGMYYEAILEEVMSDGQCNVTFCDPTLGQKDSEEAGTRKRKLISEVCLLSLLKPCEGGSSYKPKKNNAASGEGKHGKQLSRDEYQKKQQKRLQKQKDAEEEQEKVKRSWQTFNTHTKKGTTKKKGLASAMGKSRVSIFASPDGVDGRVGIGTCGISGRGMTAYTSNATVTATASAQTGGVALHHSAFAKKKQLAASGAVAAVKK